MEAQANPHDSETIAHDNNRSIDGISDRQA
jgi:hypothetical protein